MAMNVYGRNLNKCTGVEFRPKAKKQIVPQEEKFQFLLVFYFVYFGVFVSLTTTIDSECIRASFVI